MTTNWLAGVEEPCQLVIFSDALDEGEFWEWVFHRRLPTDPHPADGDDDWWLDYPPEPEESLGACLECGELGPCGYDQEGRPMIHLVQEDENEG